MTIPYYFYIVEELYSISSKIYLIWALFYSPSPRPGYMVLQAQPYDWPCYFKAQLLGHSLERSLASSRKMYLLPGYMLTPLNQLSFSFTLLSLLNIVY